MSTSGTTRCKEQKIIFSAIRFAIFIVKSFIAECFAAMMPEEVIRMPSLLQRSYAFIQYGFIAVGAPRREKLVIIRFAIWLSFSFEEILRR
jgi:hypothetical protein